ncbi:hypothetical protein [Leptolyngbya sp. PCC 6406]|uniref:hypothetical protein n=1 Tax=Leptolyngbya sp. PCC 6406 TaxID=1173264 RepID=UPI0002ABF872|nr:hypothetical protein [Leptolyngbya sp. PCC 6406]
MDPIAIAVAALVLMSTKATEKVGEKLGEGTLAATRGLWAVLRRKAPDTAKRLAAAESPEVIDAEIIEEVRRVAAVDPSVAASVAATAEQMQQQFGGVINQGKLAEKIGFVFQGGYNPVNINKFEL